MGKSKELFMQMVQEEPCLEHIENEYTYKDWIKNIQKFIVIGVGKDKQGFKCIVHGETPKEVYELALKHNINREFELIMPYKHIFKDTKLPII